MSYANLADINVHLPTDKLVVTAETITPFELDAQRIIRGYVGGVIEASKLAAWVSPETTPELIRSISGRLIAAAFYAERFSENSTDVPAYGQNLYNVAIGYLMGIKSGSQVIVEVDGTTIDVSSTSLTNASFLPNDASAKPAFTREMIFG